jgi:predicted alpha/beta-hydrolase family hydrolase
MDHPFMARVSELLTERGIGTFRYEFPYMEAGKSRTDTPQVAAARVPAPGVPLFAGGKSFGGRMTSTAQSEAPLAGVRGLVFLGFPLHAPGRPGIERGEHLDRVRVPMLFVQGSRDEFARPDLLAGVIARLGGLATLHPVEAGDHSFKVPKSGGRDALVEIADAASAWMKAVLLGKPATRV